MKRYGNLFEQVFSKENLYQAYLDARKGKRGKRACFEFEINLGGNLAALYEEIHTGSYHPQPYFNFMVYEPKPRLIYAPAFRDIVVQHAVYRVIYPLFDRTFIASSFACRKSYGTHKASTYTQQALRHYDGDAYILKLDVRKFFYSIDRRILQDLIECKIKDVRLVEMMMLFADTGEPLGIPIGNLLSQLYALIYLNPVDHFIKRVLKVRHYVRYVDDMVLVGLSRDQGLFCKALIVDFLNTNLHLELSKSTLQRLKRGVNFVGYRTWKTKRIIRKYSLYKFGRRLKSGDRAAVVSLLGHAKGTDSLAYMLRLIAKAPHSIKLPGTYKNYKGRWHHDHRRAAKNRSK
ncbi:MAG: reverse transcriptase domain-containing protein [Candidatus Micrarchaeia archaeon]|jgi:retron-type reverse transcriptase